MSLTALYLHLNKPKTAANRASRLTETLCAPVRVDQREGKYLLAVPFEALKSSGLQVVEAVLPETKVLTGKIDAVRNAENRVSKNLGERVALVGLIPETEELLFEVTDGSVGK